MLVFRSPLFSHLGCALVRNPYQANQYLVFARRHGIAVGREICVINDSTRPWKKFQYSSGSKYPCLWFSPPTAACAFRNDKLLHILLAVEPSVIQITGRTKEFSLSAEDLEAQSPVQVLPEVKIPLDEVDLTRAISVSGQKLSMTGWWT